MKKIVKYGLEVDGKTLIPEKYDVVKPKKNGIIVQKNAKFGMYTYEGKVLLNADFYSITLLDSIIIVSKKIGKNIKFGIFDYSAKNILPLIYDDIEVFYKNLIIKKDRKYMIYNFKCERNNTLSKEYDEIRILKGKVIRVTLNSKNALFDKDIKQLLDFSFDEIEPFKFFLRIKKLGHYGAISYEGKTILNVSYDNIRVKKEFIIAILKSKQGVYNTKGEELIPILYDNIKVAEKQFFIVRIQDKKGLYDFEGKKILECEYSDVEIKKDYIKYCIDNNWKIKNVNGIKLKVL